jgi:hypothetical protein
MRAVHDGDARSAFPFSGRAMHPAGVTSLLPEQRPIRIAELHLRGRLGPLPVRVLWPAPSDAPPPIAVLWPGTRRLADALCTGAGMLVVWAREALSVEQLTLCVEWVADRGDELGGDPARLVVAVSG